MKISDTPSRGKKICKNCNIYIGVRCRQCPKCGHEFVSKSGTTVPAGEAKRAFDQSTPPRKLPEAFRKYQSKIQNIVYVPAGDCPLKLPEKLNSTNILKWSNEIRRLVLDDCGDFLRNSALLVFGKKTLDPKQFKTFKNIVESECEDVSAL
jgi:hypothetical protein